MSAEVSSLTKQHENKSAVLINSNIFKLVEAVEKKIKAGHADKNLEELKVLREQCGSDNPLVSVTACHGLTYLVKSGYCPLPNTISALVSSLFSVKSVTGVTSALTEMLIVELKCQLASETKYSCPYYTKSPQHPLVAVLKRRSKVWADVLNQVSTICTHLDKQVQTNSLELVKPVLAYVLMELNDLPDSSRFQAFKIVVDHFSDKDFLVEALASCLCWESGRVLEAVQLVTLLAKSSESSKNGLHVSLSCLALAALVPRLLAAAVCPQPTLTLLAQLAHNAVNTHSTLLALLANCIPVCPAPYLEHLLVFFTGLLSRGQCSLDCTWMCVSALMPWLATNPSQLHQALHTATLIVSHASAATANPNTTATLISNSAVSVIVSADPRLTQAVHIARLSEVLRGNSDATLRWLQSMKAVELDQVHLYISALLISREESDVRLAALQCLVGSLAPLSVSHNLTLLLYQLARERQPDNQLALLRALPSTAGEKSNVMGVVSTLEALRCSGHQSLSLVALDLYSQLWMCQERCFSQLMDVLSQDCSHYTEPWLAHLLQAKICKTICNAKPELHGKEVVGKVSDILNKCGGMKEAAASALALDALVPLCRHDVVDVYTIWRSLSPRFSRDKRPSVLRSLCEIVSVAAVQKSAATDTDNTRAQMLTWLWNLVATSKDVSVVDSSLKALSKFRLDQMNLKMLPECFRKDLKLPREMAKTPVDAARRIEDVIDYIPGECWIKVLQHVNSESASMAVACWVKMEVGSFVGTSLYQVDRQEPSNYGHLHHRSVVRGVTTSLQQLCNRDATAAETSSANLCLVALAQPTPKPLPSHSWAFLGDLYNDPTVTHNIVRLTAKQAQISPSARKITENFMASVGSNKEKIEFLYSILQSLCCGIPPTILRPFLETTLHGALNLKDNDLFSTLLRRVKATLNEEIHEANRTLLQQLVKGLWELMEPQNEMLSEYFNCVSELPVTVIESMTSTSLMWEVTSAQLQKAFRLRTFMALLPNSTQPLNWINEIIEVASSNIAEQSLALQLVSQVVSQLNKHPTMWPWLQELMGQTHLTSVNNKSGIEFLVSVFVLCVDIVSGYSCLSADSEDARALRFPQAVASLVSQHGEATSVLEWLNHMREIDSFPPQYSCQFQLAARNVSIILR